MSKLVSTIIPFVNHKDFILPCFEHMQQQTYPHWELIFVDNGATDGSRQLAEELAQKHHKKVRVVEQPIKGIAPARNKGLALARGEFVSFLDVDDHFHPQKFGVLVPELENHPEASMAFGHTERIYMRNGQKVIQDVGHVQPGLNLAGEQALNWTSNFYRLPQTGATLIRTRVAQEIGGFPEELKLGNDDVAFHIELALRYPVVFVPKITVHYYRHEKSAGAKLNNEVLVEQRYLEAHFKYTLPRGRTYYEETGDNRLLKRAQKGIAGNYWSLVYKRKRECPYDVKIAKGFGWHLKVVDRGYKYLPYPAGRFLHKAMIKTLGMVGRKM